MNNVKKNTCKGQLETKIPGHPIKGHRVERRKAGKRTKVVVSSRRTQIRTLQRSAQIKFKDNHQKK